MIRIIIFKPNKYIIHTYVVGQTISLAKIAKDDAYVTFLELELMRGYSSLCEPTHSLWSNATLEMIFGVVNLVKYITGKERSCFF